ncbi:S-adenosyl-L-methionine-dependent methyltransferase [Xylaria bambusicola]|uniref:S-adenosyl-L-methionine-dependent methyltransferase n=1 Tax=Xylaria bambusicola TaxID=326684 RepID=UPI002007F341|nr:S-adenosyl-L-methionine-dependent methyltransferase [Xylaria bambusicola]KAI0505969.1 S-adenosyl-L-methionine-dependent methyltransferase [Xylaria bambusicola]
MADSSEPPKLPKFFEGAPLHAHSFQWNKCWETKCTPWDRGGPSMALHDLLKENPLGIIQLPTEGSPKRALVPGCGRGHDVLLLSSFGYDVYGLDVSSQALDEARQNAERALSEGLYKIEASTRGAINWTCQDFYAEEWKDVPTPFDLIFDYTFFCAMPPPLRPAWASRMKSLLRPGGRLVCLEFPSEKKASEPGPPWAAPPREYLGYLSNPGAQPPTDEHGGVVEGLAESVSPGGLKRLVHVKPRRTHESGTQDGRVQDYISVWAHADE